MMLLTASKAYLRHPELTYARENRDFVYNQLRDAVGVIASITQGRPVPPSQTLNIDSSLGTVGDLTRALNEFDVNRSMFNEKMKEPRSFFFQRVVMIKPSKFNEQVIRPQLEERLESIISGAALLADSLSTRDDRRDKIVQECNAVRQALQDLLEEYIQYVRRTVCSIVLHHHHEDFSRKNVQPKRMSMQRFKLCKQKHVISGNR